MPSSVATYTPLFPVLFPVIPRPVILTKYGKTAGLTFPFRVLLIVAKMSTAAISTS